MARMRQASQKGSYLSQTISGYRGYSSLKAARETDQVFSEEVLAKLSETVATVARMKRSAGNTLTPDVLTSLDVMTDSADRLAKYIADTVPRDDTLLHALESGKAGEIESLDSAILETVGNVNQALSVMELEGGTGIAPEDLDSICELLDDVGNHLRKRAILIAG